MLELPAAEALAAEPIPPVVGELLLNEGVTPDDLQSLIESQRGSIIRATGSMGVLLTLSQYGYPATDVDWGDRFVRRYVHSMEKGPQAKLNWDNRRVRGLMHALSPANLLVDTEPAWLCLETLLGQDYAAVPSDQRRPRNTIVEGHVKAQLALLAGWTKPAPERCENAADLFQTAAASPDTSPRGKLLAFTRMADMRTRALAIRAHLHPDQTDAYLQEAQVIQADFEESLRHAVHHLTWLPDDDGLIFEAYVTGRKRRELLDEGRLDQTSRLSTHHENHFQGLWPVNSNGRQINFSSDVVVENAGGPVTRYQAKASTQEKHAFYTTIHTRRRWSRKPTLSPIHLLDYVTLQFLDDFPLAPGKTEYELRNLAGLAL